MLEICRSFFDFINRTNIRYCHWKSNIRIDKALDGKTDIDILVHNDSKEMFYDALKKYDFKQILSSADKQYPGIEDYLGFDNETGRLIHLHVHFKLILGQRYIKNHHLPIEDIFFENLIVKDNIFIPCPELELIILIIRAHMKVDIISLLKHLIKDFIRRPSTPFPADIEDELRYLIRKSDIERLNDLLNQIKLPMLNDLLNQFITKYSNRHLHCFDVIYGSQKIFESLKTFRRRKNLWMYLEYTFRAMLDLPGFRRIKSIKKKTIVGCGRTFSFVGADGSGKSSLVSEIEKWLSWKLSVCKCYYGIPKNVINRITSNLIYYLNKFNFKRMASLLETCFWVSLARRRYVLSLRSQKKAKKGHIVISDRFPLKEFNHMVEPMDGPRLNKNQVQGVGSFWSQLEDQYYKRILLPDRIFILKVALDEVRRRKTDLDIETHRAKVEAVNALTENHAFKIIDANHPFNIVQLKVKQQIWNQL